MKFLIRDRYLDKLKALNQTPDINIVMINLQELDYEELLDYRKLHAYAADHCIKGRHNALIIDEVQLCDSF